MVTEIFTQESLQISMQFSIWLRQFRFSSLWPFIWLIADVTLEYWHHYRLSGAERLSIF